MPDIKLTLLVGQYAQAYYLGTPRKATLTDTVRAVEEYLPLVYTPLPHPLLATSHGFPRTLGSRKN